MYFVKINELSLFLFSLVSVPRIHSADKDSWHIILFGFGIDVSTEGNSRFAQLVPIDGKASAINDKLNMLLG